MTSWIIAENVNEVKSFAIATKTKTDENILIGHIQEPHKKRPSSFSKRRDTSCVPLERLLGYITPTFIYKQTVMLVKAAFAPCGRVVKTR